MKIIFGFLLYMLTASFAYADGYVTENIVNGCTANISHTIHALFERNKYTCESGYYLPADSTGCVACLARHKCVGGTYTFNDSIDQGIEYSSIISDNLANGCDKYEVGEGQLNAVFIPTEYTCNTGYYLPANAIACVICPANSYCSGGTYTFNETTDQGIESCPVGYSSSAGASQCSANTITINWDGADGTVFESTSCTYGGTISTPTNAPTKRGHTFIGWRIVDPNN